MRLPKSLILLVALGSAAAVAACGGGSSTGTGSSGGDTGGGGSGGGTPSFDSVAIEPASATLTVSLGGTASQTYKAFGVKAGKKTEITKTCSWSVDQAFGAMADNVLAAKPHGGVSQVSATCGALSGTSQLTIDLKSTVVGSATTPANAATLFGGAVPADPMLAPAVEYPLDASVAPVNIPPIQVQWYAGAGKSDLFHLSMTAPHAAIDVYTTDPQFGLTAADWDALAGTAAGGDLSFTVEGLAQAAPATKYVGAAVKMALSHDTIDKTALYYWASSAGSLMTQNFGETTAPTELKNDCTSCHSVSRTGSRIGYSRCVAGDCGQIFVGFMRFDVAMNKWVDTLDANNKALSGSYTTFSPLGNPFPTDDQSVAIVTANGGTLHLYDPDTGTEVPSNLADVASHGPGAPRAALMPDWSPDGKSVVYASTPHPGQWIDLSDSALAVTSYSFTGGQHVFGEPTFLVSQPITLPSGTYNNFFFPSYSPDGSLVVFNAARAAWRNFTDAGSPGQRLMLADASGAWVTDLTAANGPGDLNITWPHWAPGNTTDYLWIVFSSERNYGHLLTPQNTAAACAANGVKQCKQLWIAAVDKKKIAQGGTVDPSAPPVWLPGQDLGADNISPYWTVPTTAIPH
jgi:hypothetical protein